MGDKIIGRIMVSGKEAKFFHGGGHGGMGDGRIDGTIRVGGLVFRKLVTTEISIGALSPS